MPRSRANTGTGYVVGQRLASHADPELGLGLVTAVEGRRLKVVWPAVAESRVYAADNAPLARIRYVENDRVKTVDGVEYRIVEAQESDGLMVYQGVDEQGRQRRLEEIELDPHVRFTAPRQRLFSGQLDSGRRYELRVETLLHQHRLQHSQVRGLLGARTSLLPHQIYIAAEVARRHAPRVLLADEVGLGKTIEAGLILHRLILTGQAARVLILVPENLVHQWLVEMLRRFNLAFSIYDAARLAIDDAGEGENEADAAEEGGPGAAAGEDNPFEREQLIICSLEYLAGDAGAQAQALAAHWDMVVVDEAHHLQWSPQSSSREYRCVEALAAQSAGLLLLTATPEQAGLAGHFARLRLLDPARFHDLQAFAEEEAGYTEINQLVIALQEDRGGLTARQHQRLVALTGPCDPSALHEPARVEQLVRALVDRHGTGRVLFRNSRQAIQGFPRRVLRPCLLPATDAYRDAAARGGDKLYGERAIYPEQALADSDWLELDPRVSWLVDLLRGLHGQKVLVICHHASSAQALDRHLNLAQALRSTLFHEGMSIVERDRAAAYFAETEGAAAQALICSEIGSEGRNFQFAQHLVLFDLPPDPDLIEQRIGRLDRIGQQSTVWIHVPYIEDSAQAVLFRWLHEGLDLFEHSCSAGYAIHAEFAERLRRQLQHADAALDTLIAETRQRAADIAARQQVGRDRLLELNSCNPALAQQLIGQIEAEEQSRILEHYMARVFDEYGVDQDVHSEHSLILRPGSHMQGEHFPGLDDADGLTVTFSRERALAREDMAFLSWEHPLVDASIEMITSTGFGNASVAAVEVDGLAPGTLLLETVHTVSVLAPRRLQLERYLPRQPIRRLQTADGKDLTAKISHQRLSRLCLPLPAELARSVIAQVRHEVERMLDQADVAAGEGLAEVRAQARQAMQVDLGAELQRLQALRAVNPGVRESELGDLRQRIEDGAAALDVAGVQLQALRLIVSR